MVWTKILFDVTLWLIIGGATAVVWVLFKIVSYWKSKTLQKRMYRQMKDSIADKTGKVPMPVVKTGKTRMRGQHEKLGGWKKYKLGNNPENSFLIKMFFSNGTSREYVIVTSEETFELNKRTYHLRFQNTHFNLTMREYELDFHEDYFEPLSVKSVVKAKDSKAKGAKKTAFWHLRPHNAKSIIRMEYIKALASATELSKYLKFALILIAVLIVLAGANLYFWWQQFGGKIPI